jgi:hypothetical protein
MTRKYLLSIFIFDLLFKRYNFNLIKILMTAGSISVPTIIPLRAPVVGKLKNVIDNSVAIELRTGDLNMKKADYIYLFFHFRNTKCRNIFYS